MINLNWKQKYDDQIHSAQFMSSDTLSLVSFFEQEIISAKEFLLWAQNESLLPILRDDFFENFSHQNAVELVSRFSELKNHWSPLCIPIVEWEGHLIVAGTCFENFDSSHKVIPVLTNFQNTRMIWEFLRLHLESSAYEAEKILDDSALEDTKKFQLPELPELQIQVPQETLILQDDAPVEPAIVLSEESENFPVSEPTGGLEGLEINSTPPPTFENLAPMESPLESYNLPEIVAQAAPDTIVVVDAEADTTPGIKLQNEEATWESVKSIWSEIQDEMSTFFDRCVLVSINSELENFTEVIWSTSVSPVDLGISLTLKEPSIFRVVYTTFKPYHGSVVGNPVNESFFQNWNEGTIPAHVTIAPVIVDQKLKGLLVGIGNVNAYTNNALSLVEKTAEKIAETLKSSKSSHAA